MLLLQSFYIYFRFCFCIRFSLVLSVVCLNGASDVLFCFLFYVWTAINLSQFAFSNNSIDPDPMKKKEWYVIEVPTIFGKVRVGHTLVNRTAGLSKCPCFQSGWGHIIFSKYWLYILSCIKLATLPSSGNVR